MPCPSCSTVVLMGTLPLCPSYWLRVFKHPCFFDSHVGLGASRDLTRTLTDTIPSRDVICMDLQQHELEV